MVGQLHKVFSEMNGKISGNAFENSYCLKETIFLFIFYLVFEKEVDTNNILVKGYSL